MRNAAAARRQSDWPIALIYIGLIGSVLTAYLPVLRNDFINLDDRDYVTRNVHVITGIHWSNVVWAFQDTHLGTWHPLTWISHMVDSQLYGLWAGGHHLTSLLLHTASTVILFLLLKRLTGALWRSALVAALFGLHPLHVESVAWASERKDVLSVFFGLLSIWAYVRGVSSVECRVSREERARLVLFHAPRYYALAVLFFALGLMSKPMLVTLPLLLLLIDFWPLRRVSSVECRVSGTSDSAPRSTLHPSSVAALRRVDAPRFFSLLLEKVPFFMLSFADGLITLLSQTGAGAVKSVSELPLADRAGNAVVSYVRYLWKAFWPSDLAVLYPFPNPWPIWLVCLAAALLLGSSAFAVAQARRRPYLPVGWFWYIISITPVIGFVQTGMQAWADRYTYIPLIGVFVIISWGAADIMCGRKVSPSPRPSPPGEGESSAAPRRGDGLQLSVAVAAGLAVILAWFGTRLQVRYWQSSETLFGHTVKVTRANALAYQLLGAALFDRGELNGAAAEFRKALKIRPDFHNAQMALAITLTRQGKLEEACGHFKSALQHQPDDAEGQFNFANALQRLGRSEESIAHYEAALKREPNLAEAQNNLGIALATQGKTDEAIAHYKAALRSRPDYAEAYNNLANALVSAGRLEEALTNYLAAIERKPQYPKAENSLGCTLAMLDREAQALEHFDAAIRMAPDYADAHFNLAGALARDGQNQAALEQFEEALRLEPGIVTQLSEQPDRQSKASAGSSLSALASVYAAAGQFTNAVQMVQVAINIAQSLGQTNITGSLRSQLAAYRAGRTQP
jgi:tetratricopeptide (TPR) repeat protein